LPLSYRRAGGMAGSLQAEAGDGMDLLLAKLATLGPAR
jgi:hypothetical protein